jgi:very-short-patch-repair endonuclease
LVRGGGGMSTAADAFENNILDALHQCFASLIGDRVESPIEYKFVFAFMLGANLLNLDCEIVAGEEATQKSGKSCRYTIRCQPQVTEAIRVDFSILDRHQNVLVLVECDGRDFHHATRSQIDRDRQRDAQLAARGICVLRFPGTQIHNDPFQCVLETVERLDQLAEQQKGVA